MTSAKSAPPRISGIFAKDSPVALLFRRGPSRWTQLVAWNTHDDTFQDGAWFKGRIYAENCSISPDGTLLVYFCLKANVELAGEGSAWTAVSKVPWVSALCLWPQSTTYGGGGAFASNTDLVISSEFIASRFQTPTTGPLRVRYSEGEEVGRYRYKPPSYPMAAPSGADWSGFDSDGRLVYTLSGVLYRYTGGNHHRLRDFRGTAPDPKPPPAEAITW